MENLIDSVYGICDIYREEYRRRRDYLKFSKMVRDLKYKIKHRYSTKIKATYETYMLFDDLKWDLYDHIHLFHHNEFKDFIRYEEQTYKFIDTIYGR